MMITLGRLQKTAPWHIFISGHGPALCWKGIRPWHCLDHVQLEMPADVESVGGPLCKECLQALVRIAEIAEALNGRVP